MSPSPSTSGPAISVDEQQQYVVFVCSRLFSLCTLLTTARDGARKLSHHVAFCASTFLKRFYIDHSVCDCDPVLMMFAAIFLAAKVEECHVSSNHLICQITEIMSESEEMQLSDRHLKSLELILAKGIRLEFLVHHPHRALYALVDRSENADLSSSHELLEKWHILTDAALLYTPAVLGACSLLDPDTNTFLANSSYLRSHANLEEFWTIRRKLDAMLSDPATRPTKASIRDIRLKIKHHHNDEFDVRTEAYNRRMQQQFDDMQKVRDEKLLIRQQDQAAAEQALLRLPPSKRSRMQTSTNP